MSMIGYSQLFLNEQYAFDYSIQNKLIYNPMICDRCGRNMSLIKDKSKKFEMNWRCRYCKISASLLKYSVFSCAHYPMNTVLHLLYCWANQLNGIQTNNETGISLNGISNYFIQFRKSCLEYVLNLPNKIGGDGKIVEIDETLMCKRKYHKGRLLNQVWIFGGICTDDKDIFAVIVPDRKKETLEKEILKHIEKGSIIISDLWNGYSGIENLNNDYKHLTVNHSENFVDPDTGADTNEIERLWKELKMCNIKNNGIHRIHIYSHICEFIWRRNEIRNNKDKFEAAIKLMANTIFYSPSDELIE